MKKIQKLLRYPKPLPVILGSYVNGLGLARSFGEEGLPSLVVDYKINLAFFSKYSHGLISPHPVKDEAAFIDYLMCLGEKIKNKGFLLATNDIWLIPIAKHRKKLENYYLFPMSNWDVIKEYIDKKKLYKIAEQAKIAFPKTLYFNNIINLNDHKDSLTYPCIIKPYITLGFKEALKSPGRTIVIEDGSSMFNWQKRIIDSGLGKVPLLLQEVIPGDTEKLYTITAYSNTEGKIIAYSTGYKIRQYPPDAGTITAGRVSHEPELYELCQKLIGVLKFYGISNTEFKLDPRDNIFKLIEMNPRPGMWNYSVKACGINLPYLAYREIMGEKLDFQGYTEKQILWLETKNDFLNTVYRNKRKGYDDFALSFTKWLSSIKGKKVDAIISFKDFRPGLFHIWRTIKQIGKGIIHGRIQD